VTVVSQVTPAARERRRASRGIGSGCAQPRLACPAAPAAHRDPGRRHRTRPAHRPRAGAETDRATAAANRSTWLKAPSTCPNRSASPRSTRLSMPSWQPTAHGTTSATRPARACALENLLGTERHVPDYVSPNDARAVVEAGRARGGSAPSGRLKWPAPSRPAGAEAFPDRGASARTAGTRICDRHLGRRARPDGMAHSPALRSLPSLRYRNLIAITLAA
jgi:hypothetical protein